MNKYIKYYPDDTSYADIGGIPDTKFVFRINNYTNLWELNQLVDAYNDTGIVPRITIPWLLDGQADRRFANNQSSGCKLICNFLNKMNAVFEIYHPHNPELVEGLINNATIIDNSKFLNHVINHIGEDVILMSTDAGSYKPLMKIADKIGWKGEVVSASKSRKVDEDGKTVLTQILPDIDFTDKTVLIVDDICVYGGTFIGLAELLRKKNCRKIYLAVSHLTTTKQKEELWNLFDGVFTTNSLNLDYGIRKGDPTKIFMIELF